MLLFRYPLSLNYLSPFAVYKAFPCSDYYGDSVAMGVAPFRQSCHSSKVYVSNVP